MKLIEKTKWQHPTDEKVSITTHETPFGKLEVGTEHDGARRYTWQGAMSDVPLPIFLLAVIGVVWFAYAVLRVR